MDLTPPSTIQHGTDAKARAAYYRVIWESVETGFSGLRQLENGGVAFDALDYITDTSPLNGIPDAFDHSGHLHIDSR